MVGDVIAIIIGMVVALPSLAALHSWIERVNHGGLERRTWLPGLTSSGNPEFLLLAVAPAVVFGAFALINRHATRSTARAAFRTGVLAYPLVVVWSLMYARGACLIVHWVLSLCPLVTVITMQWSRLALVANDGAGRPVVRIDDKHRAWIVHGCTWVSGLVLFYVGSVSPLVPANIDWRPYMGRPRWLAFARVGELELQSWLLFAALVLCLVTLLGGVAPGAHQRCLGAGCR